MAKPIPLNCDSWNGLVRSQHAGTGFLVARGETTWLVTCLHLVTGRDEAPLGKEQFQRAVLRVVGTSVVVPFHLNGRERFSLITHLPTSSYLDVTALRLSSVEIEDLKQYGIHPIDSIVAPRVSEQVTANGFPGLKTTPIAATSFAASVQMIVGTSVVLSKDSRDGLSGAALMSSRGLIGVVHGNRAGGGGLAISFSEIIPNLFL